VAVQLRHNATRVRGKALLVLLYRFLEDYKGTKSSFITVRLSVYLPVDGPREYLHQLIRSEVHTIVGHGIDNIL